MHTTTLMLVTLKVINVCILSGYYCPEGSSVLTQVICPIGRHCPEGSPVPKACVDGTYTDYNGASVCGVCPEGNVCDIYPILISQV